MADLNFTGGSRPNSGMEETKITLDECQVEDLISFITPNAHMPADTADFIVTRIKERYRKRLYNKEVYPAVLPYLREGMEREYYQAIIDPGTNVGIICAQSIGQNATQQNLDAFHRCGQKVTAGVPRCEELMRATKKPKYVNSTVFFNTPANQSLTSLRDAIGNTIVGLTVKDISSSIISFTSPRYEPWYDQYEILFNDKEFRKFRCGLRISLNMKKMFEHKVKAKDIARIFQQECGDVAVVFSPPQTGIIDLYFDDSEITLPEDLREYAGEEEATTIYLEVCARPKVERTLVCGIRGITDMFFSKTEDGEWYINADGSNLKELLAHPLVDDERTSSNNVWDIFTVFGIEAARQFLIEEFGMLTSGINLCHSILMVDWMTHKGSINSVSRFTKRKEEMGPIGKASFEEPVAIFLEAGVYGKVDKTSSVSASTICGKIAKMGTGLPVIRIDLDNLPQDIDILGEAVEK